MLLSLWVRAVRLAGNRKCQTSQLASCVETVGVFSWRDDSRENEAHLVGPAQLGRRGPWGKIQIPPRDWVHMFVQCVCAQWQHNISHESLSKPPAPFLRFRIVCSSDTISQGCLQLRHSCSLGFKDERIRNCYPKSKVSGTVISKKIHAIMMKISWSADILKVTWHHYTFLSIFQHYT